jgi:hypothetical protein
MYILFLYISSIYEKSKAQEEGADSCSPCCRGVREESEGEKEK